MLGQVALGLEGEGAIPARVGTQVRVGLGVFLQSSSVIGYFESYDKTWQRNRKLGKWFYLEHGRLFASDPAALADVATPAPPPDVCLDVLLSLEAALDLPQTRA